MTKLEFSDEVYKMIHAIKPYEVREIKKLVGTNACPNERAIPYLREILIDFAQRDEGRQAGFYVELSQDELRFKKVEYLISMGETNH